MPCGRRRAGGGGRVCGPDPAGGGGGRARRPEASRSRRRRPPNPQLRAFALSDALLLLFLFVALWRYGMSRAVRAPGPAARRRCAARARPGGSSPTLPAAGGVGQAAPRPAPHVFSDECLCRASAAATTMIDSTRHTAVQLNRIRAHAGRGGQVAAAQAARPRQRQVLHQLAPAAAPYCSEAVQHNSARRHREVPTGGGGVGGGGG